MYDPGHILALDIETDTSSAGGLDPTSARITEIVLSSADGEEVFAGDEGDILAQLDHTLINLPPSLIATWNGTFFDGPFISDRAFGTHRLDRRDFGLRMWPQPGLAPKYDHLPGHATGYALSWVRSGSSFVHTHLDTMYAYRPVAAELGVSWSLKPVCKALGIAMFDATGKPYESAEHPGEVDRTKMHLMPAAERKDYAASDGRGTRELALRMLGLAPS